MLEQCGRFSSGIRCAVETKSCCGYRRCQDRARNIRDSVPADVNAAGEAAGTLLTSLGWGYTLATPATTSIGGAGAGTGAGLPQVNHNPHTRYDVKPSRPFHVEHEASCAVLIASVPRHHAIDWFKRPMASMSMTVSNHDKGRVLPSAVAYTERQQRLRAVPSDLAVLLAAVIVNGEASSGSHAGLCGFWDAAGSVGKGGDHRRCCRPRGPVAAGAAAAGPVQSGAACAMRGVMLPGSPERRFCAC